MSIARAGLALLLGQGSPYCTIARRGSPYSSAGLALLLGRARPIARPIARGGSPYCSGRPAWWPGQPGGHASLVARLWREIIDDSLRLQHDYLQHELNEGVESAIVAFQGVEGAYSFLAQVLDFPAAIQESGDRVTSGVYIHGAAGVALGRGPHPAVKPHLSFGASASWCWGFGGVLGVTPPL